MNAYEFVTQQAEALEASGNTITITHSDNSIHVMSKGPGIMPDFITLHAWKNPRTGRWNLMPARVYRVFGADIERRTYSQIRNMVWTYGSVWKHEMDSAVTA